MKHIIHIKNHVTNTNELLIVDNINKIGESENKDVIWIQMIGETTKSYYETSIKQFIEHISNLKELS